MNLLSHLFGSSAMAELTVPQLVGLVEPRNLPSHLRTSESAQEYRAQIAALYEASHPGPSSPRGPISAQLPVLDDLLLRQRFAEATKAAQAKVTADKSVVSKRLAASAKARTAAEADWTAAVKTAETMKLRVDGLAAERQAISVAQAAALEESTDRLKACVKSGDAEGEKAAAIAAAEARSRVTGEASKDSQALELRLEHYRELHRLAYQSSQAAEHKLTEAVREDLAAQIAQAALTQDEALDDYAIKLLGVLRASYAAEQAGHADLCETRGVQAAAVAWVGDYSRTWFDPEDRRMPGGRVLMGRVLGQLVRWLDGAPFDLAELKQDLRAATVQKAAVHAAPQAGGAVAQRRAF